jgi:hypothetical protein
MRCKVLLSISIPCNRGGLRWPLYCCISRPPLSLLPSNIEARALLKASFCRALLRSLPAAAQRASTAPCCYLFLPPPNNASDAALLLQYFSAQRPGHRRASAIF